MNYHDDMNYECFVHICVQQKAFSGGKYWRPLIAWMAGCCVYGCVHNHDDDDDNDDDDDDEEDDDGDDDDW